MSGNIQRSVPLSPVDTAQAPIGSQVGSQAKCLCLAFRESVLATALNPWTDFLVTIGAFFFFFLLFRAAAEAYMEVPRVGVKSEV